MSIRERVRIEQRTGRRVDFSPEHGCSMLDEHGRCTVYDIRPMICRLYGTMETMPCPHGCLPVGGLLGERRAKALYDEVDRVGGLPPNRAEAIRRNERLLAESRERNLTQKVTFKAPDLQRGD
jgi:Fe-S-cluster containining protein